MLRARPGDGWTYERALHLLREEAGTAFDARCVQALERVLDSSRSASLVAV